MFSLQYRVDLIGALEELRQHEEGWEGWMEERYVEILTHADRLREQWKDAPMQLELLRTMLVNLFIDKGKLQGRDVSRHSGKVTDALGKAYSFDALALVFKD